MPENNQASDKTKPEATGSSSTQPGSQAIDMNHTNVIVPHRISNHDKLLQTMVMVDGEWVNINDTNDQKNVQEDMHKVNRVVTEAQKDIINAQNAADSAVKSADSAISASKVNSDAIAAQSSAIIEAKSAMDSATAEIQQTAANAASDAASIRADIATVQSEVNTAKTANETEVKSIRDDLKMANSSIATVKDHLGNVSSELDTYAKSAATQGHDITIIQQKQGQFEVDYAGTKGDVNQIKANIKGLSENLKNSEGDVASLQATAKELQSSMSDAEGNISNLQVTAKSYDKIFEDHLGRISKVEQTASELINEFSDQQGHLNRVDQTAQGTQQTVANQQGQINTIKNDAAGIHQTITGQGNQIANINVTLNGLSSKYEGVEKSGDELKNRLNNLSVGTRNLLHDTNDQYRTLTGSGRLEKSTALDIYTSVSSYHGGDYFTYAATITNNSTKKAMLEVCLLDANKNPLSASGQAYPVLIHSNSVAPGLGNDQKSVSFRITSDTWFIRTCLVFDGGDAPAGSQIQVKDERLVEGSMAGTWSPNPTDVADKITTNSTQINQNKKAITLKADQTTVDNLSGEVSQAQAQLKVQADQISSKVSSEDFKTLDNKVGGAIAQIDKNTTAIDQTNKQISLKADQTEVDKVKQTATQNSSRLNVMANEISSKVTSTDVNNIINGKGYATTSTVQSLISQKAGTINESITNLTNEMNTRNGVNLLKGTRDFSGAWQTIDKGNHWFAENWIDPNGNHSVKSNAMSWAGYYQPIYLDTGDYTFSGYYYSEGGKPVFCYIRPFYGDNLVEVSYNKNLDSTPNGWRRFVVHFKVTKAGNAAVRLESGQNQILHIASYKLERGTVANPVWTPAPSDNATVTQVQQITASIDGLQSTVASKADRSQITQLSNVIQSKVSSTDFNNLRKAVDLQTLESADANNLKTNGHYFVHNLANNPVGGWVYVDVTGNGNDRIRQDVYQDIGNKHKYRRWFGNSWTNWSEGATESEITQLRDDINLRVTKGDLLSQINIEAGRTLIQSNKIYFDADSFVMSPNSKAFIPSAYITNINADKITTGTLDASKLHVKNFSAGMISGGTLKGIVLKSGSDDRFFQTSADNIYWSRTGEYGDSIVGTDRYLSNGDYQGLVVADDNYVMLANWGGSSYENGKFNDNVGLIGWPRIVLDYRGYWNPDVGEFADGHGNTIISSWISKKEYLNVEEHKGVLAHLDDSNSDSQFRIQKDNHIGAYFGEGNNGNQINFNFGGDGGFNVNGPLHVTGSKNSIVETRQGYLAINAYETAEYYFGDIGENNTGDTSQVVIGIDRIFNEVVNTDIQYQVFVTPYSNAHVWVEKRYNNRFIVKSDRPNAEFGWELKAKRKGYEDHRLRRIDVDFKHKI